MECQLLLGDFIFSLSDFPGTSEDATSQLLANILNVENVPQISYKSSSETPHQSSNFLRVIPSNTDQIQVIMDLVKYFKWQYVSVIASDDELGRQNVDRFSAKMKNNGNCVAFQYLFNTDQTENCLSKIFDNLRSLSKASSVVILWSDTRVGLKVIQKMKNLNITWILSWPDPFPYRFYPSLTGSINIILKDEPIENFNIHRRSLDCNDTSRNFWLGEYWRALGFCLGTSNKSSTDQPHEINDNYNQDVMATVYAISHGLHKLLNCSNTSCPGKYDHINYELLVNYTKNAKFRIPSSLIDYDMKYPVATRSYNVMQYHQFVYRSQTRLRPLKIGEWHGNEQKMLINPDEVQWKDNIRPTAKCSEDCLPGQRRIDGSSACCWKCVQCEEDTITRIGNQFQCQKCLEIEISNENRTRCILLTNDLVSVAGKRGVVLMSVAILGAVSNLIIIAIFIKYWETPIVKSSSREMSMIQLMMFLLMFCSSILYYLELTPFICKVQMLVFGTVNSSILSFIVIKTYRLLCVFKEVRFSKVSKYLKNKYQIPFGFIPIILQVIFQLIWFYIFPVKVFIQKYRHKKYFINYCSFDATDIFDKETLLYTLIGYIMFLSVVSGVMAFRARKLPQRFNEAQFIWYAMFALCSKWVLALLVYLSSKESNRAFIFIISSLIITMGLLFILYGYKVGIMICYPKLNSKEYFKELSRHAVVTTYVQDGHIYNGHRKSTVSVIQFDFDGMFDEYKKRMERVSKRVSRRLSKKEKGSAKGSHRNKSEKRHFGSRKNSQRETELVILSDGETNVASLQQSSDKKMDRTDLRKIDLSKDVVLNRNRLELETPGDPSRGKDSIVSSNSVALLIPPDGQIDHVQIEALVPE